MPLEIVMDEFQEEASRAVATLKDALQSKERNATADLALKKLAGMVQEAFEEISRNRDGRLYHLTGLYSKTKLREETKKIRILAEIFTKTFRETVENFNHSALWQIYGEDPLTPRDTQYDAAVLLFAIIFSFSRLVECPEDWWYRTEDQHFPLLNCLATLASEESRQLRALLSGTYALFGTLVFDDARHSCTFGEASNIVDGHLTRIETYILALSKSGDSGRAQVDQSVPVEFVRKFQLAPLSPSMEARFLVEFLSSFESYPHIRNDPIKKSLEKNLQRILDVSQCTLRSWQWVEEDVSAPILKLTANMIKASPIFARKFSSQPMNWSMMLNLPLDSRVAVHVSRCVSELVNPRFWCTGDPVGASLVLNDYLSCLEALSKVECTESAIAHLRAGGAPEIFDVVLTDRRTFDSLRTKGKEEAVGKCCVTILAIRLLICKILASMCKMKSCRQFFLNGNLFHSAKNLNSSMDQDSPEKQFLDSLPAVSRMQSICLSDVNIERNLGRRLWIDSFFQYSHSLNPRRRKDYRYAFQKLRKTALVPIPPNTGDIVTSTFVGPNHEHFMMRSCMGHLILADVRSQKIIYSIHDWMNNEEDHIECLPLDCSKFLTTSGDLVTDTDAKKSHLWSLSQTDEKCHPLVEYKNFQFMRASNLHPGVAIGHAAIWRRKHGHYFTLDMETKEKIILLGPLNEEENHPNFPSFHPSSDLAICMGSVWDYRSGCLVHRFDHFRTKANCVENVFHANGINVLIDDQVWDLRTYGLVRKIEHLKGKSLQFSSSGDVLIAKKSIQNDFDDLKFYDPLDYSTICQVPINGIISDISIDRMDYRMVVCRRNGFPLLMEIGTRYSSDMNLHLDFVE